MRIGMMVDLYKPHISGITNYIDLNKRHLEQLGHEVYVFTFGDPSYADDEKNVIRSPGLPLVDTGYYLGLRYTIQARKTQRTMDVVHVHHPFLSGRLALQYCRPVRIPVAFTNHTRYDLYAQAYLPLLPDEISATFLQAYMPPFCQALDLVISPSQGMADPLRGLGVASPVEIVPNGVDLKRFHGVDQPCHKEDCGFHKDDLLLVFVGRLGPEKNLKFLLRAFTGAAEALENIHLLIIGDGPEKEELQRLAAQTASSQRVHIIGFMEYERLPAYLAMCDVFVTASITEVHPLSVIEAMAAGLPTLGIHSVGVGDTVVDGMTGFLSSHDPAAFSAHLTRLCLDKALRQKMGLRSRRESEVFDISRTTRLMLALYERMVFDGANRRHGLRYRVRSLVEKWKR